MAKLTEKAYAVVCHIFRRAQVGQRILQELICDVAATNCHRAQPLRAYHVDGCLNQIGGLATV